jgi:hypothetical protein
MIVEPFRQDWRLGLLGMFAHTGRRGLISRPLEEYSPDAEHSRVKLAGADA